MRSGSWQVFIMLPLHSYRISFLKFCHLYLPRLENQSFHVNQWMHMGRVNGDCVYLSIEWARYHVLWIKTTSLLSISKKKKEKIFFKLFSCLNYRNHIIWKKSQNKRTWIVMGVHSIEILLIKIDNQNIW